MYNFSASTVDQETKTRQVWSLPLQKPSLKSLILSVKSSKESIVMTFSGLEAICSSSELSTLRPIPKANTAAPLFRRRDETSWSGVYGRLSVVCFPSVITKTGYRFKGRNEWEKDWRKEWRERKERKEREKMKRGKRMNRTMSSWIQLNLYFVV